MMSRAAWGHPVTRRLLAAFTISRVGDEVYFVALFVEIYRQTHSPGWLSACLVARLAVASALGRVGGLVADRFPRRTVMIAFDLFRLAMCVVLVAATVLDLNIALLI